MAATNNLNMRDFIPSFNLNADFFRDCMTFTSLTTASHTIFRRMPDLKRQIPKEFGDPVQVWDALQPEVNIGRFLTYRVAERARSPINEISSITQRTAH